MGKQTIHLHIGLAKTGTTAIQQFVRLNREAIAAQGLRFLETDLRLYRCWDSTLMAGETVPSVEATWKPVKDALREADSDILHSNESFTILAEQKPDFVRDIIALIPDCTLKVVVYLRRQDRFYESGYLQNVEYFGGAERFDPAPADGKTLSANGATLALLDYHSWLTEMRAALRDEDELIVRAYDKAALLQGSLFKDFMDALGLRWEEDFALPPKDPNPTIDGRYAELCRKSASFYQANTVRGEGYEEAPFENMLFYQMLQLVNQCTRRTGNKNLMTADERKVFLARFAESNQSVARDFLHRDGPLFDESDLDDPKRNEPDTFEEGELETALLLLHRIWLECASFEGIGGMNYLRLRRWRREKRRLPDDAWTSRMMKLHKTLYSLGKRLFGWGKVPQMEADLWSMPSRNAPPERLMEELRKFIEQETRLG